MDYGVYPIVLLKGDNNLRQTTSQSASFHTVICIKLHREMTLITIWNIPINVVSIAFLIA